MTKLSTIFVEGITDVRLYAVILETLYGCKKLDENKEKELGALLDKHNISDKFFPRCNVVIRHCTGRLVFVQGVGGDKNLVDLLGNTSVIVLKNLWRRFSPPIHSRDFGEIDGFSLWFVLDEDVKNDPELYGRIQRAKALGLERYGAYIKFQSPPEKFTENLFQAEFSNTPAKKAFSECVNKFKERLGRVSEKREFTLIKAILGERCYDNLFENLLKKSRENHGSFNHIQNSPAYPVWIKEFFENS